MNVLLVTLGSHGDIFPFLAIGRSLARRGHACRVATHPWFHAEISAEGLEPVAAAVSFPMAELIRHRDLFHRVRGPLLLARHLAPVQSELAADVRRIASQSRVDVIVAHYGALSARWVAEALRIPCASAVLAPTAWHHPADRVPTYQIEAGFGRAAAARIVARLVDPPLRLASSGWIRKLRSEAGVGRARGWPSVWDEFRAGDAVLGLWPEAYRPRLAGDPERSVLCGFPWSAPASRSLPAPLAEFLDAGPAPVVFTLGSAAVNHPGEFFGRSIEAVRRLGVRAVLLTGRGNPPPAGLPSGVLAVEWASHAALFPRARVNVHHAGIGSTAEALRAGRPSLAVPHAYDQFNNALRVGRLGAGLALSRHRLTVQRLVRALDRAIHDESLARRAAELAPSMAADGAEAAADAIERLRPRTETSSAAA